MPLLQWGDQYVIQSCQDSHEWENLLSFLLLVSHDGVTEELVLFCAHCCLCVTIVCILW